MLVNTGPSYYHCRIVHYLTPPPPYNLRPLLINLTAEHKEKDFVQFDSTELTKKFI